MAKQNVPRRSDAAQIAALLASPEIEGLIAAFEATRETGRRGYSIKSLVGMALAKSVYSHATWTKTVRLASEHDALRAALGGEAVPSIWACYRFTEKLRAHPDLLDACLDRVLAVLHEQIPEMGTNVAVDGSDMPAYGNGQKFLSKNGPERKRFSDPDATWGHRSAVSTRKGGGFYRYKLHASVCTATDLPLAWTVATAKAADTTFGLELLDAARKRGFLIKTGIMDKGYDNDPVHQGCMDRGIYPVTPPAQDRAREARQAQPAKL